MKSIAEAVDLAEQYAPATVAVEDAGTHEVTLTEKNAAVYWSTSAVHLRLGPDVKLKMAGGEHDTAGHVLKVGDNGEDLHDIRIYGQGSIDGNNATNDAENLEAGASIFVDASVTGLEIDLGAIVNAPGDAVKVRGRSASNPCQNVEIALDEIRDCYEGILAMNVDGFEVSDTRVSNTLRQDGIEPARGVRNFRIHNCRVANCEQSLIDVFGGATDGMIANCDLEPSGSPGVYLSDSTYASTGITITNNHIHGGEGHGIAAAGAGHELVLRDNTIQDITGHPVQIASAVRSAELIGNDIKTATEKVGVAGRDNRRRVVKDNIIKNVADTAFGDRSIAIGGERTVVSGNIIEFNANEPPEYGLYLTARDGYTTNNHIPTSDFAANAIHDDSQPEHEVKDNYL